MQRYIRFFHLPFYQIMITIFGYWRCSTDAQDQERQIRALKDAGCEKIVGDKITGTSNYGDRESLSKLLEDINAFQKFLHNYLLG